MHDKLILSKLLELFRCHGFEGTTLTKIAQATGLKRSSLYHRFPGGKEQMAEEVLNSLDEWFSEYIFAPLATDGLPEECLKASADAIARFYVHGKKPCILEALSLGATPGAIGAHILASYAAWRDALCALLLRTGRSPNEARRTAERMIGRIQGALIIQRLDPDSDEFQLVLDDFPRYANERF